MTQVFFCTDPETGELRPLSDFPIEDLGDGWHRQGCFTYCDRGSLDLGIVREAVGSNHFEMFRENTTQAGSGESADAPPAGDDPQPE